MPFTDLQLDELDRKLVSGVKEVRFQDRTEVRTSVDEMLKIRAIVNPRQRGFVRQVRMYSNQGW